MKSSEHELKCQLSQTDFQRLFETFQLTQHTPIIQHNTYYDTANQALKQSNSALRLRNFATSSEWTLKAQVSPLTSEEYTQTNPNPLAPPPHLTLDYFTEADLRHILSSFSSPIAAFKQTYHMLTHRWQIPCPCGLLVLDQTAYLACEDYELELEIQQANDQAAIQYFKDLLAQHHIDWQPAPKKIARVAAYYQMYQS